jgi:hypothetical protein
MIAEPPSAVLLTLTTRRAPPPVPVDPPLSIGRVVAGLQLVLAARRAVRTADHEFWDKTVKQL